MIITLTEEKKQKVKMFVLNLLRSNKPTITYLAKFIRTIISCIPAAILGPFFCHYLENDKITSLRSSKEKFDATAKIKPAGKQEREWWLENNGNIEKLIALLSIHLGYFCDLSLCSSGANFDTHKIGGAWNLKENPLLINFKELLAVYYSLKF